MSAEPPTPAGNQFHKKMAVSFFNETWRLLDKPDRTPEVELPKVRGVERGTFTGHEVKMLVETAQGEWQTLILLAYECVRFGVRRVSEQWKGYSRAATGF